MSADYTFDLPPDLIAQQPPARRGDSRLMLVDPVKGAGADRPFRELDRVLRPGDRLVLNESRVLPARLHTLREDTGGQVEVLLLRPDPATAADGGWLAMARPARRLKPGQRLVVQAPRHDAAASGPPAGPAPVLTVLRRGEDSEAGPVAVGAGEDLAGLAETWGVMPLPPYIRRAEGSPQDDAADRLRYQTVYAADDARAGGSVAAPTAGLHFSQDTLARLEGAGIATSRVSLHVGPGTFKPPSEEQIAARRLHLEHIRLPAQVSGELAATRAAGGRVIAVGTTALRTLETVARLGLDEEGPDHRSFTRGPGEAPPLFEGSAERIAGHWQVSGATRLFVGPPDRITAADGLLTNFHLPGSSLLMLVAALLEPGLWRDVYAAAVGRRLRFYSYGDCMLILPQLAQLTFFEGEESP